MIRINFAGVECSCSVARFPGELSDMGILGSPMIRTVPSGNVPLWYRLVSVSRRGSMERNRRGCTARYYLPQ